MKVAWVIVCIVWGLLLSADSFAQAPEKGAKDITLNGGMQGKVPFPHHAHQAVITDCKTCHEMFPQKAGVIDEMKKAGTLKSKKVMNVLCVKCHREKKAANEKTGPLVCTQCHIK